MAVRELRATADPLARAVLTFLALASGVLSLERWAQHHRSLRWAADVLMGLPAPARLAVALAVAATALYLATRPKRAFGRILVVLALTAAGLSLLSGQRSLVAIAVGDAIAAMLASSLWAEQSDPVSSRLGWSLLGVALLCAAVSIWALLSAARGPHPAPVFLIPLTAGFLSLVGGVALLDRNPPLPARRDVSAALRLYLGRAGSSVAPFALMRDKRHFWARDGRSFLAFGCSNGVAMVLGPPIGEPDSAAAIASEFRSACRRRGWRPAWYQVPELAAGALAGTWRFAVGREALVDVSRFSLEGRPMANVRHQVTKARRLGVSVDVMPEPEVPRDVRSEMDALADRAAQRSPLGEMAFSIGRPGDPANVERIAGLALRDRQLVGYVTWLWLPAARTMVLDEVKRAGEAPPGTSECLMAACLDAFRGRADVASLGLAPVASAGWEIVARIVHDWLGVRSASPGLSAFKTKFRPTWEPRYLVVERLADVPAVLLAGFLLHHPELSSRARAAAAFLRPVRPPRRQA
ncbi:MAG TPA: DUF2156 domain-containing protein [Candidatus Dormibacteraeota bacterium]